MAVKGKKIGNMVEVKVMIPISLLNRFDMSDFSIPNLDEMVELEIRKYLMYKESLQ